MKAISRLILPLLLLLLAACGGEKDNSEPPAPLTQIDSPMPLRVNWRLDTSPRDNDAAYRLRPLLVDNRLFSIDTGGTVSIVDAETGRRLRNFETRLAPLAGLGGNDSRLIAVSQDGDVVAYRVVEKGLEEIWRENIVTEIRAPAVLDGDQVFVRSVDGKLRALSAIDGSPQWLVSHRVPALSLTGNSPPLVYQDLVVSGFDDGKLLAFNRVDGQVAWEATIGQPSGRTEVERLVDLDGSFVVADGVIYVASFQGRLAAVQAVSGDLLWSREFSSYQAIAIDDDAIYLSSDRSHIWSIDRRTGSSFWKQDVLNARNITAPSIVGDRLVVADLEGYLHWFNKADGALLGRIRPTSERSFVQPLTWQQRVVSLDQEGMLTSVSARQ